MVGSHNCEQYINWEQIKEIYSCLLTEMLPVLKNTPDEAR